MNAITIIILLAYLLSLCAFLWRARQLRQENEALEDLLDRALFKNAEAKEVAKTAYPYLPQTSTAAFYGIEGQQANFAQRQEIAAKVQAQNDVLRRYVRTFDITVAEQAAALNNQPKLADQGIDMMESFRNQEKKQP